MDDSIEEETDMDKWIELIKGMENTYDSEKEFSIADYKTIGYVANPTVQSPGNIYYYFVKDNMGYSIAILYTEKSDGMGDKILSTFKFTK